MHRIELRGVQTVGSTSRASASYTIIRYIKAIHKSVHRLNMSAHQLGHIILSVYMIN